MTFWWRMWEGIISEYWDGEWWIGADDLPDKEAIALRVLGAGYLAVAIDHKLLYMLAMENNLLWISQNLRLLLVRHDLNTPGRAHSVLISANHWAKLNHHAGTPTDGVRLDVNENKFKFGTCS